MVLSESSASTDWYRLRQLSHEFSVYPRFYLVPEESICPGLQR